jgi:uncharacterized protein (TIGR00255 family)
VYGKVQTLSLFTKIYIILNQNYTEKMTLSMTGFGIAEADCEGKRIVAEVRSLNSKQLDTSIKLPPAYRPLELDVRTMLQTLQRGKIDMFVSYKSTQETAPMQLINQTLFVQYWQQLKDIEASLHTCLHIKAGDILCLPEVANAVEYAITEKEKSAALDCCSGAIKSLTQFREKEGAILMQDILHRVQLIEHLLMESNPLDMERIENLKERLRQSVASAVELPQIDQNRFEQELIYYLEKFDVTEERTRLMQHCHYFVETANEECAGRKLSFIAQEMGREINTLGSKANHSGLQRIVVQMKDELEKIKEQVLNIL